MSDLILIGKIVAAQGLRGEVRVQTFTEKVSDLRDLKPKDIDLKFIRDAGRGVAICKVAEIDSRDAAEKLRGTELFISRGSLPPLPVGEYYQTDLIGLPVNISGAIAGTVDAIHNFGAGDIIELDNGDMISFLRATVDIENKIIFIK